MTRTLGLDYGEKRIGVSISDPLFITAQPLHFLLNDETLFERLAEIISEYVVSTIVLGLPLNAAGEDSAKCSEVRDFATQLETQFDCPIAFWDERFSTVAVNRHLIDADVSRKKRNSIVDSQAAMFILQGYMDKENR